MAVLVLGDQLTARVGPLADAEPGDDRVVMIESTAFARRKRYHPHKLVLVFAAMRHFRDRLRDRGFDVDYHRVPDFQAGFEQHLASQPTEDLVTMRPASHGAGEALVERFAAARDVVHGDSDRPAPSVHLLVEPNETFLCTPSEFDDWATDKYGDQDPGSFRHEDFYRWMRDRTGYLMDDDGDPEGGAWNFDDENRQFPRPEVSFPDPPDHGVRDDPIVREVADWVTSEFETWPPVDDPDVLLHGGAPADAPDGGSDLAPFRWPVTREGALAELDAFVRERLPAFGPYQDAMVERAWHLNHALLSPAVNLGLLSSTECIDAAIDASRDPTREDVELASVEGFVRQLLGWREFVRHVYRREMPAMATANQLDATESLPDLFWTGDTDMRCLEAAVGHVRERGYAHHIERLMLLSNVATTYGVDPAELNAWFHLGFVDAYHWVTTPNVVGMGTFGSPALSTKPYVSSANYVGKMSDHCTNCAYDPDRTTGEDACPVNALYWDFLAEHEDRLRSNHRMGLVYSHVDRKRDAGDLDAIRERADDVRDRGARGDL